MYTGLSKEEEREDNMSQTVISLSGKAKQVFRFLELLAKFSGSKTLKDLAE